MQINEETVTSKERLPRATTLQHTELAAYVKLHSSVLSSEVIREGYM